MDKIIGLFKGKEGTMEKILKLEEVIIDNDLNPRQGALDQDAVLDYSAHVDELPPMTAFDIQGLYYLVGGFHRYAAHQLAQRTEGRFVIHQGSREEAKEFADLDNLRHGLKLTRAERRLVIVRQLKRHPEWSDVRLATVACTTDKTVRAVREQLEADLVIPRMDRLVGADGIERPRAVPRPAAEPVDDGQQATFESEAPAKHVFTPANEVVEDDEAEEQSESVESKTQLEVAAPQEPGETRSPLPPVEPGPEPVEGPAALESAVPTPPPPPPAKAALPPPVIGEVPWSVNITIRPNGSKPLISIWHGQEQKAALPADLAAKVHEAVGEHTEVEAEAESEDEAVPAEAPEWLVSK